VVEFHEPPLVAAMAAGADVRATSEVPDPDGAFVGGRNVTRSRVPRARLPGLRRVGELLLGQVDEQSGEGPVENGAVIPGRDGMAWQSMSFASRSFSSVSPPIVSCSL
jgi:hypothetical protein